MPPSRRKPSNNTTTARAQQTLAFGPTPNKITKASLPTAASASKKKPHPPTDTDRLQKALSDKLSTTPTAPSEEANDDNDEYPPPPERQLDEGRDAQSPEKKLAIRAQGEAKAEDVKKKRSEIEEKGARVSEAQIKRYWKGKEEERIAPRVHQGGLSVDEKILRHFDLSTQYGVCHSFPPLYIPYPVRFLFLNDKIVKNPLSSTKNSPASASPA